LSTQLTIIWVPCQTWRRFYVE